jgi:hypothetical protein
LITEYLWPCKRKTTPEADIEKILEFLTDNIFVAFANQVVQQAISMDVTCAPLLADLFLYRYEAGYILKDLHEKSKHNFPLPYAV